ncbi:hypothetical protein [Desulfogranum marinum]|uniref:hypothetical protein n=1 Tax=Desulfogranum marinum TaxID=453220 RepID=UPI001963F221|nr:hypothetical protein [Desulfogranum marinum]MBM9514811.1 hypothetical protein [Desulfogranum marinum]
MSHEKPHLDNFENGASVRIVYYTRPFRFDLTSEYAAELTKQVELHLVAEIAPESRQSSIFEIGDQQLQTGANDGTAFFKHNVPKFFTFYLPGCSCISLVAHNCPKIFHPRISTARVVHNSLAVCNIFCQWIKASLQDDGRTVFFFGRISPYKDVEVLVQAATIIA